MVIRSVKMLNMWLAALVVGYSVPLSTMEKLLKSLFAKISASGRSSNSAVPNILSI